MERYLTCADVAERMGVHPETVRRWCKSGDLPSFKLGPRIWRIAASDLAAYQQAHTSQQAHTRRTDRDGAQ